MAKTREEIITLFAEMIEKAGFNNALEFVKDVLVPLATTEGDTIGNEGDLSLWFTACAEADDSADQDTSAYQLWLALTKIENDQNAMWFD